MKPGYCRSCFYSAEQQQQDGYKSQKHDILKRQRERETPIQRKSIIYWNKNIIAFSMV